MKAGVNVYLKAVGFSLFTGATFNVAKYSVNYFSPAVAAAWRFGLAAAALLLLLGWKERLNFRSLRENVGAYLLLGGVGIFGFNALFFLGIASTSPVNGALIMAANPVLTAVLAVVILGETWTLQRAFGIALSLGGVILVITHGSWETIRHLAFASGDIWVLLGNLCWALYSVMGRKLLKPSSTPLAMTTYSMVVGAVALMVLASFHPGIIPLAEIPVQAWASIVFMALGTSVLGYLWWNQSIKKIGASRTAVFFNLVPVVTMIVSVVMGISATGLQMVGMLLVIAGVFVSSGLLAGVGLEIGRKPSKHTMKDALSFKE